MFFRKSLQHCLYFNRVRGHQLEAITTFSHESWELSVLRTEAVDIYMLPFSALFSNIPINYFKAFLAILFKKQFKMTD